MKGNKSNKLENKEAGKDCLELKTSANFIELTVVEIRVFIFRHNEKEISNGEMV